MNNCHIIFLTLLILPNLGFADSLESTSITNLAHTSQQILSECQRLNRFRTARVIRTNALTERSYNQEIQERDDLMGIGVCEPTVNRLGIDYRRSTCSGTLIGDGLLLTASHCIDRNTSASEACENLIFEFANQDSAEEDSGLEVGCSQILYSSRPSEGGSDFAIIQLERHPFSNMNFVAPVSGRGASLRWKNSLFGRNLVSEEAEIYGYPHGGDLISSELSNDIDFIQRNHSGDSIVLSGFSMGGMSGGGVYNQNCELIGVTTDMVRNYERDRTEMRLSEESMCFEEGEVGVMFTNSRIIRSILDRIETGQLRVVDQSLAINDPRRYNIDGPPVGTINDIRRYRPNETIQSAAVE
jgi:V8-like Glu-specific endopeptidase